MKNVYLVQVNDLYGDQKKSTYIPYAAGCIQAYCMHSEVISSHYKFGRITYCRDDISAIIARFTDPYMVLFSCSVWNTEFNKALAASLKKVYPACLVLFGGHHVSSDRSFLSENPFVDYVIHNGGEEPTAELLEHLALGFPLDNVPNLSFRDENGIPVTTPILPQEGSDYPSPYLEGIFDDILTDDVDFSVILETNRGCPNSCAFCDWGQLKCKVRLFPLERVFAEIDWFAAHKIEYVYCADANFCLFNRDADIVDYVVNSKNKYGYPKVFRVCFTKNRFDFVFNIGSKLVENGLDKAHTLSFQSMDPQVLENIGRTNISNEDFRRLMHRYAENRISTYSELIIGLPGETYGSFCAGLCEMFENGQHFCVNTYPCELLPNSEMGQKEYIEKYKIKTVQVPFKLIHSDINEKNNGITEYSNYIVSTCSMNEEDWIRSLIFAYYAQAFHNLGLLRPVAIYARYERGIPYVDFYQELIRRSASGRGTLLGALYERMFLLCRGLLDKTNALVAPCDDTEGILWGFDEILFLETYKTLDRFYSEVKEWLENKFGKSSELDALFRYQCDIIKKIDQPIVQIRSDYDFYSYFNHVYMNDPLPLAEAPICLTIKDPRPVFSFAQLARETIWYGRNRRESDYTSSHYTVIKS